MRVFLSVLLLSLGLGFAQDEVEGVLSYIDIDPTSIGGFGDCVSDSADTLARDCLPHVEVVAVKKYEECLAGGDGCEALGAFPVNFFPEEVGIKTEEALAEAWDRYYFETIKRTQQKVNELPFCWLPSVCPVPNVRWDCVAERLIESAEVSLTELLPEYWIDVNEALVTHLPTALWWENAFPEQGAVVAPVFSLTPKPEQIANLFEEPRDGPYYLDMTGKLPVPYLRSEAAPGMPGLVKKELKKYGLKPATIFEYQQFGYATFFEAYGDFSNTLFFDGAAGPYLFTWCVSPWPPYVFPIPVPTPLFIPMVPRAFTAWVSVPEGYSIPRVKGEPLW